MDSRMILCQDVARLQSPNGGGAAEAAAENLDGPGQGFERVVYVDQRIKR